MTSVRAWVVLGAVAVLAVVVASCRPAVTPSPAASATYTDPFAYCAAVRDMDRPDARYVGPDVPESVAQALKEASGAAADAPLAMFVSNSAWRCMNGQVYGCFVGANIPCWSKADTSRTPSAEAQEFCKQQPNADFIPAVATGRETVYTWRCTNGTPEIVEQVFQVDGRGFVVDFWYPLSPK